MIAKISLMELYVIETLRANNIPDDEIIAQVKAKNIDSFVQYDERFDFTILYTLEEAGILETALHDGYEIKFLTFTGLVNILNLVFNKREHEDYDIANFTISRLQLSEEETITLTQMLSSNWTLSSDNSGLKIRPIVQPS